MEEAQPITCRTPCPPNRPSVINYRHQGYQTTKEGTVTSSKTDPEETTGIDSSHTNNSWKMSNKSKKPRKGAAIDTSPLWLRLHPHRTSAAWSKSTNPPLEKREKHLLSDVSVKHGAKSKTAVHNHRQEEKRKSPQSCSREENACFLCL